MKTTRPIFPQPTPSFQSARLLFRPMDEKDLLDFFELRTQFEVMQWTSTGKVDPDHAFTTTWMKRFLPPNDGLSFSFAIEELANPGKIIGTCGTLPRSKSLELGYMFRKEVWNRGYGTEAIKAWLTKYWKLPRQCVEAEESFPELSRPVDDGVVREVLHGEVVATNYGSQRVLEKCGFVRGKTEPVEDQNSPDGFVDLVYYYLLRPTSEKSSNA